MAKKIEIILLQHIVGLGAEGDQVKVAAGYARNYLLPHRLALLHTAVGKRRLEALRQARAQREAHELNTMTELAKSLSKMLLTITVKTGEDGKMHGAVTNGTIADELKNQFEIALDRKKIHLEKPIKSLGELEVEMRLHPEVKTTLKITVVSSTPPPAPVAPPPAKEGEQPKDARGRRGPRPDRGERRARPARDAAPEAAK